MNEKIIILKKDRMNEKIILKKEEMNKKRK
jgi:hypothetical protein